MGRGGGGRGHPGGPTKRARRTYSTIYHTLLTTYLLAGCAPAVPPAEVDDETPGWYKGNLHTHSFWSDGDDYPEIIVRWYQDHGYDFLAISDHNTIMEGEKWVTVPDTGKGLWAYEGYVAEFGEDWVETREQEGTLQVRLKNFEEFREHVAAPGDFLLIRAEEISDRYEEEPIHVNATNLQEYIAPQGGSSVLEVMQNNVDAVLEQRERTGRDMFPHINHPNFFYAVSPEDLIALEGEKFFEVYNGHPSVNNHGDHEHPSTERLWDIVLAHRLTEGRGIMYGLATDDAHRYHEWGPTRSNPGLGWVVVRAPALETGAILAALERGDFYSSTGVALRDVVSTPDSIRVEIAPEPGVTYTTHFVGTRMGFTELGDSAVVAAAIGDTLAVVDGTTAAYGLRGDELYVRARIVSSRPKVDARGPGEREMAWTQPVQPAR